MIRPDVIDGLRVKPGTRLQLARRRSDDHLGLRDKECGQRDLEKLTTRLDALQMRLWAERRRSLLLVLQGIDTAGKDGVIRHVFTGVNPQAIDVHGFRAPSEDELTRDYLWRVHAVVPPRGTIGIFNRSHYEDVVTVRVLGLVGPRETARRYRQIVEFERMLSEEGTTIVKLFLHISADEQRQRLLARVRDPEKSWKFNPHDLDARAQRDAHLAAYSRAISATSTRFAPWYVIPADHKWVRNVAVSELLVSTLQRMRPRPPRPASGLSEIEIN